MKRVLREGGKSTLINYIGILIGFINVIFIFPYFLDMGEFGIRSLLIEVGSILVLLPLLGINSIIIKYSPHYSSKLLKESFNSTMIIFQMIMVTLFLVVYYWFLEDMLIDFYQKKSPLFISIVYLLPWYACGLSFYSCLVSIFRCERRVVEITFLKEIFIRLLTLVVVVLYSMEVISAVVFWQLIVGVYLIVVVLLFILALFRGYFKLSVTKVFIDKEFNSSILSYGAFSLFSIVGALLVTKVDVLMLGSYVSQEAVGIYSLALFMVVLIDVPKKSLVQVVAPVISEFIHNNNHKELGRIYRESSINLQLMGTLVVLSIWFSLDLIYELMPQGESFKAGKYVFLILGFAKLIDVSFSVNNEILSLSKKYQVNFIFNLGLVVIAIVLNEFFITKLEMEGAAFASLLSIIMVNVVRWFYLKRRFGITPFQVNNVKLFMFTVVLFFTFCLFDFFIEDMSLVLMLLKPVLCVLLFVGGVYFLKISAQLNDVIKKILP